jgi:hypothetical protein
MVQKNRALKKTITDMRRKIYSLQTNEAESVPIYPGAPLKMNPSTLAYIIADSRDGCVIRNFIRYYFTVDEMKVHSRTGKPCAANLHKDLEVLPPLDPLRMDTIFGKHRSQLTQIFLS